MSGKPDFVLDASNYAVDLINIQSKKDELKLKSVDEAISNIKSQKQLAKDYEKMVNLVKAYKELLEQDIKTMKEFYGSVHEFDRKSGEALMKNPVTIPKSNKTSSKKNSELDDSWMYHFEYKDNKSPVVNGGAIVKNERKVVSDSGKNGKKKKIESDSSLLK